MVAGDGRHFLVGAIALATPVGLLAQASYYDLDAGRPTRIEDGVAVERFAFETQLVPVQMERMDTGTLRLRLEPKFAFGALPMTQFELRAPWVHTRSPDGSASKSGVSGIGFGVLRALTIERTRRPAVALFGEVLVPGDGADGAPASYTLKGIVSKTTRAGRLHANGAIGTYGMPEPRQPCVPGAIVGGCGGEVPVFPDPPCDVRPRERGVGPATRRIATASTLGCGGQPATQQVVQIPDSSQWGPRWFLAIGVDRALPVKSILMTATTYVERFTGPYQSTDWATEIGVRYQLSPQFVVDAGVMRRLTGSARATGVALGLTYGMVIGSRGDVPRGEAP